MDRRLAKNLIRCVGKECGYTVAGNASAPVFDVYIEHEPHDIAFQIRHTNDGYLEVHRFDEEEGRWGPVKYSLRTMVEVVAFCQMLINAPKTSSNVISIAFNKAMSTLNVEMDFLSNGMNASNPGGRPHENLRL